MLYESVSPQPPWDSPQGRLGAPGGLNSCLAFELNEMTLIQLPEKLKLSFLRLNIKIKNLFLYIFFYMFTYVYVYLHIFCLFLYVSLDFFM